VSGVTQPGPRPGALALEPARLGRRIGALAIDWALASSISAGFFGFDSMATLAVFGAMTILLLSTLGATIGHRLFGLGVRRLDGGAPGPARAAVRTLGICLVVPAVVWGPDGRGLHDRWSGTSVVRLP